MSRRPASFVLASAAARIGGGPLCSTLQRPPALQRPHADAIVVLGVPAAATGQLSLVGEERVVAAVDLYHRGFAPIVCITGGAVRGVVEAEVMAERARSLGVPEHALRLDTAARTTRQNAAGIAALVPAGATVWLVTQPYHLRRSMYLFRRVGLVPLPWHIDDSLQYREPRRALRWIGREYAAWTLLAIRNAKAALGSNG